MTRLPKHLGIANRSAEIRGDRPTEEKLNGVNEAMIKQMVTQVQLKKQFIRLSWSTMVCFLFV